jgi:hypothetical protein
MSDIRHWRWDEATGCVYEDETFPDLITRETKTESYVIARVESDAAADPSFGDGPVLAASQRMLRALTWYHEMFMPFDHIKNHAGTDCVHCQTRNLLRELAGK